ncbi:unnamed protein product [Cladocopium goreaui]|uniref:Secreted protein n=1 Tax=Cladocopium goreaui TaxID=2562237 RepID=A0A9P1DH39_9DINO|nr:unnamed protein product [Cladocopium goreaui]
MILAFQQWSAPPVLMLLCLLLIFNGKVERTVDVEYVEVFAGVAEISKACRAHGMVGSSHDLAYSPHYDLCGRTGFLMAVNELLRAVPGSLCVFALCCNSYCRMSRATSGRGILCPLGDMSRKFVREGNLLASRLILMLWICASRGLIWLVEQPEGSVFNLHPRWQEFVAHCPVPRQNLTNMFVSKNQQWLLPKGIHIAMFLVVWHPKRAPTTLKIYQQKFGKTLLEHVIVRIFLVEKPTGELPQIYI